MTIIEAVTNLTKLRRALRRLKPAQGRVARMNARHAVRVAMHAVERAMDEVYPNIAKERRRKSLAHLTPQGRRAIRERKLRARGLIPLNDASHGHGAAKVADLAQAGVRVTTGPEGMLWVPAWTAEFKLGDVSGLRACKRASPPARRALLAERALLREES